MLRRLRSGCVVGLALSALAGLLLTVNALAHGGVVRTTRGAEIQFLPVLFAYLLSGPITGALYGAVLPWLRRAAMAYLLGFFCSLPSTLALSWALAQGGDSPGWWAVPLLAVLLSLMLGGPGGLIIRGNTFSD